MRSCFGLLTMGPHSFPQIIFISGLSCVIAALCGIPTGQALLNLSKVTALRGPPGRVPGLTIVLAGCKRNSSAYYGICIRKKERYDTRASSRPRSEVICQTCLRELTSKPQAPPVHSDSPPPNLMGSTHDKHRGQRWEKTVTKNTQT